MPAPTRSGTDIPPSGKRWKSIALILICCLFGMGASTALFLPREASKSSSKAANQLDEAIEASVKRFPTLIRKPQGNPAIETDQIDAQGKRVTVACAVCHMTKPANTDATLGTALVLFHQHLQGSHGKLTCVSCHNPADGYTTLRLADGKAVPFPEVMMLCAQCHGPQYRDYQQGAHGGMAGFWDTTRGPRTRNNCVDCHPPHAPKYQSVHPAIGPNDRFLTPPPHGKENGHE